MAIQQEFHAFKGMNNDLSVSKFSNEFMFDAMNIRITARGDKSLLSVTNEKGNEPIELREDGKRTIIKGTIIGHSVLNNYLVLFTTGEGDYIYRLENKKDYFEVTTLYDEGRLYFSKDHPIESISIFENENVQKVYWVDGINPVRFINITKKYDRDSDIFNFKQNLQLEEKVTIESNMLLKGEFPSGVVQYVFTYFNNNGSESNIFYHSPLYYSHMYNRGGSPEEKASNTFDIGISNLESKFDYVRVYSIVRTSIDATPTVKRVVDLNIVENSVKFTDNNTTGETIDPTLLLYLGGENVVPECITHKDNTLFLGNYTLPQSTFSEEFKEKAKGTIYFDYKQTPNFEVRDGMYDYTNQLDMNSYQITTFKANETYRFGIQFQNRIGRWSEVLWVGDFKVNKYPSLNYPTKENRLTKQYNNLIKAQYILPSDIWQEAEYLGYVKVRGVVVYPNNSDKDVVCQGVLNPTVYKADDRDNNSPYAQSSWFFRPYVMTLYEEDISLESASASFGSIASYIDSAKIRNINTISRNIEIGTSLSYKDPNEGKTIDRDFYVDANIVTMHSPDIEFDDNIKTFESTNLQCRIIGYVNINNCKSFRDIQTSTPSADPSDYGFYTAFPENINRVYYNYEDSSIGRMLISGVHWIGKAITGTGDSWEVANTVFQCGWLVSPWQRSGSLINDFAKRANSQVVAKLKHNRLINTRVSYETTYNDNLEFNDISKIAVFDSNENSIVYIGDTGYSYYGNVDKVLIPGISDANTGIEVCGNRGPSPDYLYRHPLEKFTGKDITENKDYIYSKDPVSMKYKSTKHAIFKLNNSTETTNRLLLPTYKYSNGTVALKHTEDTSASYTTVICNKRSAALLWLAELYRTVPTEVKFGGQTEDAFLNNRWHIAGDPVDLRGSSVVVDFLQGDTYFQRYDCLKTYPYTLEDENNVTEILSFYCETRTNIDGRYDKNRANFNNLAITPNIFNLINPVYTQTNNFFNYFVLDKNLKLDDFNTSITWSKEKYPGEQIDQWTNITLASTLDLDGDKGEITALKTFNNEIYCFQKSGFSNILFNSRVQIPASDGVPIEITNGFKVQGKRYISEVIGCTNKWSIVSTSMGLYFIDNNTDGIYRYSGQLESLSNSLGFSQWIKENSSQDKWSPVDFNNFILYYDKSNGDIYFTNKDKCLCYSETIGQFTSFMNYESIYPMFNMNNKLYSFKGNILWEHFSGEYNMFYGEFKPYHITVVSNSNPTVDKVYNTIEFRADSWSNNNTLLNNNTFSRLDIWNEYQHGSICLNNIKNNPSSLKKKFRVWRVKVPRDSHNMRDRIRNTWAYIKLSMDAPNTWKTELHDMVIQYFM